MVHTIQTVIDGVVIEEQAMDLPELVTWTLGRNLKRIRNKAPKMTQAELAKAAGVSRATITEIESGESDPRLHTLVKLAIALEVTLATLVTVIEIK